MSYEMMLIGAQAAGIAQNIVATRQANRLSQLGTQLDLQALDLQMAQNTLASTEQAVMDQRRLRETLSLQNVLFGARGQDAGQGSARAAQFAAAQEHGRDERARELNLGFAQTGLKAKKAQLSIGGKAQKAANANKLMNDTFGSISFNSLLENKSLKDLYGQLVGG